MLSIRATRRRARAGLAVGPRSARGLGRRWNTCRLQDVAHQRGGDVDAEVAQLADDPDVASVGVLARQPQDELAHLDADRRPAGTPMRPPIGLTQRRRDRRSWLLHPPGRHYWTLARAGVLLTDRPHSHCPGDPKEARLEAPSGRRCLDTPPNIHSAAGLSFSFMTEKRTKNSRSAPSLSSPGSILRTAIERPMSVIASSERRRSSRLQPTISQVHQSIAA